MKMTSQRHARYFSIDLDDDVTLVFHKPSWQLRASLASVLITPVLYQLYLIMVTIRYILFLQTFSCESVKLLANKCITFLIIHFGVIIQLLRSI